MDTQNDYHDEDVEITDEDVLVQLKKVKEKLKACEQQKGEYLAGWQRAKADFINARNEEERTRKEFIKFGRENFLRDFLPIIDSMTLAMGHNPSDGLAHIYRQIIEFLKQNDVVPIESVEKEFNPREHEALEEVPVDTQEKNNIIIEELQKGYMIDDRVLRPAKVKVGIYQPVG